MKIRSVVTADNWALSIRGFPLPNRFHDSNFPIETEVDSAQFISHWHTHSLYSPHYPCENTDRCSVRPVPLNNFPFSLTVEVHRSTAFAICIHSDISVEGMMNNGKLTGNDLNTPKIFFFYSHFPSFFILTPFPSASQSLIMYCSISAAVKNIL